MIALVASAFPCCVAGQSKLKSRQGFYYRKHRIQVLLLRADDLCFGGTRAVEPVGERA
jgi:hypothetical protein